MLGVIFSIIAGAVMSFQGVINTRLSDKAGLFEANAFVQGTAFVLSVIIMLLFGSGNIKSIFDVDKVYLTGGLLGLVITVTVMLAMRQNSPTVAISVILIAQLLVAACIDAFSLLNSPQITFTWGKYIGLFLMICGVLVFKFL